MWRKLKNSSTEFEMLFARRRERTKGPKPNKRGEVELAPPDDSREMSIYPNEKEIRAEESLFWRKTRPRGVRLIKTSTIIWVSSSACFEKILSSHSEIESGLYQKNTPKKKRSQNLHIYENVEIMNTVCTRAGIGIPVIWTWETSEGFHGSIPMLFTIWVIACQRTTL